MDNYDDIINLEHPEPINHPRLSMDQRAGQFSSFAALSGYEDEVVEAGRITENEINITDDIKDELDKRLGIIIKDINNKPTVNITYFIKDNKKSGGKYINRDIKIKSIDLIKNQIITINKETIRIEDIIKIDGDLFKELYK